jgi:spore germination protein
MASSLACSPAATPVVPTPVVPAPDPVPVGKECAVVASLPYWAHDRALESFKENINLIDHLSVFWYHMDPEGNINTYLKARESPELIDLAHQHGVKVFALIANLPDDERGPAGDWDAARVGRVIRSEARRAAHIADLIELTRRMRFDGILIDYEALPCEYRGAFTDFIKELGDALHDEDKLLAVAIHPKTCEGDPKENNGSRAQDWDALHRYADQLHFMIYSQHTAATRPGPVASLEWVERVLRYALEERQVPRAKLYMGVPLYAEAWRESEPDAYRGLKVDLTFADVQQRKREHEGVEMWSAQHHSPYMEFHDGEGIKNIIWFENQQSSQRKLALAADLGVCNIFLWRLGGEDPGIWQLLRDAGHGRHGQQRGADSANDMAAQPSSADAGRASEPRRDRYPRLKGEASAEVEYYTKFAATNPEDKRDNLMSIMDVEQEFEITSRLALHSDVRVVMESDGEDERFYSEFPYEGIYLRSLLLQYESDHFSAFGGRYEAAASIRGHAPIFFGNYSTELNLDRRIGFGASARLENKTIGRHILTGHLFYRDTSRLSGEIWTAQGRNQMDNGGVGNTGRPDNYLVTLNGGTLGPGLAIHYTLGGGVQQGSGGALDERAYLGALLGTLPLRGHGRLRMSVDLLSLRNAGGHATHSDGVGFGAGYANWPTFLGVAYWLRFSRRGAETIRRMDAIMEIVARYGFGEHILVEAAYQNIREGGDDDHSVGVMVAYVFDWLVKR